MGPLTGEEQLHYREILKAKGGYVKLFYHINGFFIGSRKVNSNNFWYKISISGEELVSSDEFDEIHFPRFTEKIFATINTGLTDSKGRKICHTAIVNEDLKVIFPPIYQSLWEIDQEFIKVNHNGLVGLMNIKNELIIDVKYEHIELDVDNDCFICKRPGGYDLVDHAGVFLSTFSCSQIRIQNGFVQVFHAEGEYLEDLPNPMGWYGLYDLKGKELIPVAYRFVSFPSPGGIVSIAIGDISINYDLDPQGEGIDWYFEAIGARWGLATLENKLLVPFDYEWMDFTRNNDYFLVNKDGRRYYLQAWQNDEGIWGINGGKWGLINISNNIIVPIIYDRTEVYEDRITFRPSEDYAHLLECTFFYESQEVRYS